MTKELINYFKGDELAANVWSSKYQLKNTKGEEMEKTPDDMHKRISGEFTRIYLNNKSDFSRKLAPLSKFGLDLQEKLNKFTERETFEFIYSYLKDFKYIVPQGSIMSIIGNPYKIGSLSNCYVIDSPYDSYGGIMKTDQETVQLMKRRGGVGINLSTLRPNKTYVSNSAGSSTGVSSFSERYSNSTREVAQDGRRGALMLMLSCLHPDIFDFVKMKSNRSKVTGANVSVMLTNEFLNAAENNEDFLCKFPINYKLNFEEGCLNEWWSLGEYNKLFEYEKGVYLMKVHAKELFDLIIEMAWENAEPGLAFIDIVHNYSPESVYEIYKAIAANPCSEQFMQKYDSCRLLAINLLCIVNNKFENNTKLDLDKLYEIAYIQQWFGDLVVELELEYIQKIINKIKSDPEPKEVKQVELDLWYKIYQTAKDGRRTGCGFTALGDVLAALNLKYDSEEAIQIIEQICASKMEAELDCTIDLAILYKPFEGWDPDKEFVIINGGEPHNPDSIEEGKNDFYQFILNKFPNQCYRMIESGRRQINFSTIAPTGSVSILTQTTSGLEPLFLPYYMRRKKINPNDKESRVDFIDALGDKWQQFPILHPQFKEWLKISGKYYEEGMDEKYLKEQFEYSPWFGSCANDIDWEKRVKIQSIIQKYTTNAISSTINLPNNVSKEEVAKIYWKAWKLGLKGITVDICRSSK